jgi:3-hydroxyacyl-[acyl-carrier-protein] dehydratase
MEVKEILKCLPHRYPFLLIDRVLACEPHKNIRALKNVTVNEHFFVGHFPSHPVMPGVLIVEAMAQAAAILAHNSLNGKGARTLFYYFAGIDNLRFKRPVIPGDQLVLEVMLQRMVRGIAKFSAKATVAENLVAEGDLLCTIREQELV